MSDWIDNPSVVLAYGDGFDAVKIQLQVPDDSGKLQWYEINSLSEPRTDHALGPVLLGSCDYTGEFGWLREKQLALFESRYFQLGEPEPGVNVSGDAVLLTGLHKYATRLELTIHDLSLTSSTRTAGEFTRTNGIGFVTFGSFSTGWEQLQPIGLNAGVYYPRRKWQTACALFFAREYSASANLVSTAVPRFQITYDLYKWWDFGNLLHLETLPS